MALLTLCVPGAAQKGTAPNGYYPGDYSGDTYTGKVVVTEERQITLEYTHKSKTESFTAVAGQPCTVPAKSKPGTVKEVPLLAIPKGSVITVFYSTKKTKEPDGTKREAHVMIGFFFNEVNGEKLTDPPFIACISGGGFFKVF
jgi:hypothetical protein